MKAIFVTFRLIIGMAAVLTTPAFAAMERGLSATLSVGAIVIDLCQVSNAYRAYVDDRSQQINPQCIMPHPSIDSRSKPITIVTRATNGVITAMSVEF